MSDEIFSIKIEYKNPIELTDFSESLTSLASEFKSHIFEEGYSINADEIKLYIYEIEKGSIVAKIKAAGKHLADFDKQKQIVDGFLNKTKDAIDYFLNNVDLKPELNIERLQNYKKIIQPAASDNGTSMAFNNEKGGTQNIHLTINNVEANAVQHKIEHEIGLLKLPENFIKTKVLFYCFQARNDKKAKAGDLGIIEHLNPAPVKTIYMDEKIKERILKHPFDCAYVIDVEINTINGKPKLYKVLKIHEELEKD